jgi:2-hydroxychromene-2-carboxylate isomerase
MKPIDFWFSIGSTYTCLTVLRLKDCAARESVEFAWQPFDVRAIMTAQQNIPFKGKPAKMAYMWRDIERRAARYGIAVAVPAPYPLEHLALANRVALVGVEEGWCPAYVRETYALWFRDGLPAGSEPNLSRSLTSIGQDPSRVIARANSDEIAARLEAQTARAEALGIFGAPSFVVDGELFWGDDRLDDAIAWHRRGRLD